MKEIIEKIIEILSSRIQLTMIILGLITILIAALGTVPIPNMNLRIDFYWRIFIAIIGIVLYFPGIMALWYYIRQDINSAREKTKQVADKIIETIACEGTLADLYIGDSEKVVKMPEERRWIYELQNVLIKIYHNELSLEYKALIKTPHSNSTEIYRSYGSGSFIDGVAYIVYSYDEIKTRSPNWKGVMVLRVPRRGLISGYWLTTDVNRDDKFPIGLITLKRKI